MLHAHTHTHTQVSSYKNKLVDLQLAESFLLLVRRSSNISGEILAPSERFLLDGGLEPDQKTRPQGFSSQFLSPLRISPYHLETSGLEVPAARPSGL